MADSNGTAKTAESRARGIRATGRRRKGPTRRRRALTITLCALVSVVLLGGAGLGYVYFKLNGNLKGVDINAALGKDRPNNVDNGSMDILVMGSDSRAGKNGQYGKDEGGARSDTAMVLHVYKGHKKASVVSVPRDTMIKRPDCAKDGKDVPGAQRAMFNTAVRGRRPGLCRQDRRVDERNPHGPLRRGRLHRLQEAHRRAGRRGASPPTRRSTTTTATCTSSPASTPSTARTPSASSGPGTASPGATAATSAASSSSRRSSRR